MKFKDTEYTQESLEAMSDDDLLTLRNDIAEELGIAKIGEFKDHTTAVTQTVRALERANKPEPAAKTKGDKPKKPKAEPKERGLAKSAEAKTVKRPTRKMFSTIEKTGEHDGSQGRTHRWPNYKDGMTIVDVMETEGTEPWDVYYWAEQNIMKVTEPTDEQFAERKAAWYKKHGLTDPEVAKEEKKAAADKAKAEKAEAKAKADAEKAEKKAAADKAKADKAAADKAKADK